MSVRFERFVKRIGLKSEFLPIKNQLLDTMKEDAKAKYKRYPELIGNMNQKWVNTQLQRENDIAHLLSENVNPFVIGYLTEIIPFSNRRISYSNVKTPSRLDFIITISYLYSLNELKIIDEVLKSRQFPKEPDVEKVAKYLVLYGLSSFAMPIQEVFKRPFAFIPQQIDAEFQPDKTLKVSVSVQGREQ